jgi:hypothetical protein
MMIEEGKEEDLEVVVVQEKYRRQPAGGFIRSLCIP